METIPGSAGGGVGGEVEISGKRRPCPSVMKTWRRGMESGKRHGRREATGADATLFISVSSCWPLL